MSSEQVVDSDQMIDWEGQGPLLRENQVEPGAIRRGLIALGLRSHCTVTSVHTNDNLFSLKSCIVSDAVY